MFTHAATRSLAFKAPDPLAIRDLFPDASRILTHPEINIQVRHTLESTRVLKNLGFDVPSPILSQYNWPGKYVPFDHQRVMADVMTVNDRVFNLSEPGTGKTNASLWAADYLMNTGQVHKALILAPLSMIDVIWKQDIFDVLMHRNCVIVHGSPDKRKRALGADVDFYISNHDAVTLDDFVKTIRKRKDIDLVIVDEASIFRNAGTDKFRFLEWMIQKKKRVWLLTGTPCPNAPTDAWALAKLVDSSRIPPYFGRFQSRTMVKVSQYKWVPKPQGAQLAYDAMQPAVRFKKADCLTLPPVVTMGRQAKLTKEQRVAYEGMKRDMVLAAQQGQVNAVNAADKINKLRQILCGAVKDPTTGTYIDIPHHYRTQELLDCIAQAGSKALVIVPFKGIIRSLEKEIAKSYSVAVLNGDVSRTARRNIIVGFKTQPDPHVLLCHPKVMAHGLNLTEADTLIFYAPIYSNDEYEQVIERFNRTGQTRKMTIHRIGAHPLEWSIYQMVDERRLTQATILDLYATVTQ